MDKKQTSNQTNRPLVLFAIILAMFLAAVEATIVATAMPSIVSDLGGFSIFSWVFASYLLMQVVSIPIYGKLADIFGRKIVFTIGILIFLFGSILCGFAFTMEILIIGRFIQGLGAGAVQPIATTIVGDIYSKEERASIQGYLASIWGISSILGPLLGGIFVELLHWSWIFFINIPFGLLSLVLVWRFLHERVEQKKKQQIDYIGSFLLFISVTSMMLVLTQGGVMWEWHSVEIYLSTALFFITFVAFLYQEYRFRNPILNMAIWKNKLIAFANIASFTSGALLLAISTFLPTYVQGVMGQTAMVAGFTLTMISVGWPISSTIAGKLMLKIGFRITALIGGIALVFGSFMLLSLTYIQNPVWAGVGSFFVGVGMGFSTTTFIVAIQSSVHWQERGVATASNSFMRILGGAVGVALLGGVLNSRLAHYLQNVKGDFSFATDMDIVSFLLDSEKRLALTDAELAILREALQYSLSAVYWGIFGFAVISLLFILRIPKDQLTKGTG